MDIVDLYAAFEQPYHTSVQQHKVTYHVGQSMSLQIWGCIAKTPRVYVDLVLLASAQLHCWNIPVVQLIT